MSRKYVIQELERPTKSDILPVDKKGDFSVDPAATNLGKVKQYLDDNFKPGDLFDWGLLLSFFDMTDEQITSILCNLVRKGIVQKVKNRKRFFFYIGSTIDQIVCDDPFVPGYEFQQRVKDLVGDEYKVVGNYTDWKTPVEMLHEVCGKTFMIKPSAFAAGVRCSCLPKSPFGNAFVDYVHIRSCGLYEVRRLKSDSPYIVRNTETGEEKVMSKARIMQELERPTPSPVLPVKNKGAYDRTGSITNVEKVMNYLENNIGTNAEFNISELGNAGLNNNQVNSVVQRLQRDGVLLSVDGKRGYYVFVGRTAVEEQNNHWKTGVEKTVFPIFLFCKYNFQID